MSHQPPPNAEDVAGGHAHEPPRDDDPLAPSGPPALNAQGRTFDQEKMQANFTAMQEHAWFTGGGWITDYAAAKAKSNATGRPIFAYFTRTYQP